jgi:K(+)-stimulated pyrophosphate-energized sodium pump
MQTYLIISFLVALAAFSFAVSLYRWVLKQPSSNAKIAEIGGYIQKGASTFLTKEYWALARFAGVASVLIFLFLPSPIWVGNWFNNLIMALAYLAGTVFSGIAGKIGIQVATIANVKTSEAALQGIRPSFLCGFRGGAVMGMAVVGSSLAGVALIYWITGEPSA